MFPGSLFPFPCPPNIILSSQLSLLSVLLLYFRPFFFPDGCSYLSYPSKTYYNSDLSKAQTFSGSPVPLRDYLNLASWDRALVYPFSLISCSFSSRPAPQLYNQLPEPLCSVTSITSCSYTCLCTEALSSSPPPSLLCVTFKLALRQHFLQERIPWLPFDTELDAPSVAS